MFKGVERDAVYYALIIIFLGLTLYLLAPVLLRQQAPPAPSPPVINSTVEYPAVNLVILTSSQCRVFCDSKSVESSLRGVFVNLNVHKVYVEDASGRQLAESLNLSLVPAYLFDSTIEHSPAFQSFSPYLRRAGSAYVLNTLEAASGYLYAAPPSPRPELLLFVTSYDSGALRFENATFNVLSGFNRSIDFHLHFVVNNVNNTLSSVHGPVELTEDAIQLCALQSGSTNALNAIACRTNEILACYNSSQTVSFCAQFWQACMQGWSINPDFVESCVRTRNQTLLQTEAQLSRSYTVGAVPTMVIGNQYRIIGSMSEDDLHRTICAVYPSLSSCAGTVRVPIG